MAICANKSPVAGGMDAMRLFFWRPAPAPVHDQVLIDALAALYKSIHDDLPAALAERDADDLEEALEAATEALEAARPALAAHQARWPQRLRWP